MKLSLNADLLNNSFIEEPGQFEITKCEIKSKIGIFDLTHMITALNLYESIFKTFVTGEIFLLDRDETVSKLSITGTEPISLEFKTLGSKYSVNVDLIVSKIKDKEKFNNNTIKYTLSLSSPDFLTNIRTKISRSFDGSYSDIVERIYTDYLSSGVPLWLEKTKNSNRIIAPNKSPIDVINMICQFARSSNSHNADFLFFQTTKSFHFRSVVEMIYLNGIRPEELLFKIEEHQPSLDIPIASKYMKVIDFEVKSDTDILKHTAIGTYGSSLIKHHLRSKTWKKHDWNYHDTFKNDDIKSLSLNEYPITPDGSVTSDRKNISEFPDSNVSLVTGSEEYQYQKNLDHPEFQRLDYINSLLQRNSEMKSLNLQRAQLKVSGMSGLQAGDVINLRYDGSESISGLWLIESLSHQISDKYYCVLMIIKNSNASEILEYSELNYGDSTPEIIDASPMGSSNK
jgi:hypothetical protein